MSAALLLVVLGAWPTQDRPAPLDPSFRLLAPPEWTELHAPGLRIPARYDAAPLQQDLRRRYDRQRQQERWDGLFRLGVELLNGAAGRPSYR